MTSPDYGEWKFWFDVIQFFLTTLIGLYVWVSNRQRATKQAIDRVEENAAEGLKALDDRVDEHSDRLITVERELQHVPGVKDIGEVHFRVDQIGQGVEGMKGEMKQINHTLRLVQEHLMGNGK